MKEYPSDEMSVTYGLCSAAMLVCMMLTAVRRVSCAQSSAVRGVRWQTRNRRAKSELERALHFSFLFILPFHHHHNMHLLCDSSSASLRYVLIAGSEFYSHMSQRYRWLTSTDEAASTTHVWKPVATR